MKVLLTNDDGINAPGLRKLYAAFNKAGHEVFAVAPARQQSGSAHAVTVFAPLLADEIRDGDFYGFCVHGTPADCVKLGLGKLCPFSPDLVISGINHGPNAGPDIHYSGTVGAASEAANLAIPAIAVSRAGYKIKDDLGDVAVHLVELAMGLDWQKLPKSTLININYPESDLAQIKGVKVCPQSTAQWPNDYKENMDPRGKPYWWFASELDRSQFEMDSDRKLLEESFITVTPLKFDYTDYAALDNLKQMMG